MKFRCKVLVTDPADTIIEASTRRLAALKLRALRAERATEPEEADLTQI